MKLFRYIIPFFLLTLFIFISSGCSSDGYEDDPDSEIKYSVEFDFSYPEGWDITDLDGLGDVPVPYLNNRIKEGIARNLIYIYKADRVSTSAKPVATVELEKALGDYNCDFSISVSLPEGDYVVKAWTDFMNSDDAEPYYDISLFPRVMLIRHSGISDFQDAFSGSNSFSVTEETGSPVKVTMSRPVGRYVIIEQNFSELTKSLGYDTEELVTMVSYSGFYPDTYSVITDRLTDSVTGEHFDFSPFCLEDGSAIIGADFMLMNTGGSALTFQLRLVNKAGKVVASSETITVPMNRNEMKILKGEFLKKPTQNGGFDMDTDFEGDFNITT